MKNQIKIIIISMVIFICNIGVKAYELSSSSPYFKIKLSNQEYTLYIPTNQVEFLQINENKKIVNTSSNNISFISVNSNNYSFRISSYGKLQYRTSTSASYIDANYTLVDTNISNNNESMIFINQNYQLINTFILFFILLGVVIKWFK